ncbi:hypothetical protein G210_5927 [Candida maltosa Xu316]|uniref:Uncharacterized protein n=1 Tax=Candida maltosa (strain Xu316) TaxID=1245528 RepID=M3K3K2_CANMX|nr:hypothetical protein G210_5927 [Candida maltosa Xu316]
MEKNHLQTLHYLLQEFPGKLWINSRGGSLKSTPLHYSCTYNFKEGTKLLLEFGAKWDIQDSNGDTCLHLCFQYGSIGCLYELIKYIVVHSDTKEEAESRIRALEKVKNKNDWRAKDYSLSFDLLTQYEEFKKDLLAQDHNSLCDLQKATLPPLPTSDASTMYSANKILASPIISMSSQVDDKKFQGRQHSQSLPPEYPIRPPAVVRKRSNTAFIYKPPPSTLSTVNQVPSPRSTAPSITATTPTTPQTVHSSLKGVTISPSIRNNNGQAAYNSGTDDEPASPQSIISTTSSFNASPNYKTGPRKKSFSFSKSAALPPIASDNAMWPSFSEEPTTTNCQPIPQTQARPSELRPRKSSSASSIAARVAFNSSRSSLNNQSESPRKKQESRTNLNNGHSNSLNSSSSIGSMTSSSSGSVTIGGSVTTTTNNGSLRKTKSSGTLPTGSIYPTTNGTTNGGVNGSTTSLNSNGSDNLKKFSVHSISFSRVR